VLAANGPLDPVRAAAIGLGLLGALRAAHRAGVLHRDIKPSNVLLRDDDRVVLTDFGIATVEGDTRLTRSGLVLGSPAYIAPERARGGIAGPESDLWSLGATLYAAVEGRSPYERPSVLATLAALASEEPDPPRNAGPLRPALNGLLRKDPAARITAAEAERLLRQAAKTSTPPARRFRWPWTRPFRGTEHGVPRQRSGTALPTASEPSLSPVRPASRPADAAAGLESPPVEPEPTEVAVDEPASAKTVTPETPGTKAEPAESAESEAAAMDDGAQPVLEVEPGEADAPASREATRSALPVTKVWPEASGADDASVTVPATAAHRSPMFRAASARVPAAASSRVPATASPSEQDAKHARRRSLIAVVILVAALMGVAGWLLSSDSSPTGTISESDAGGTTTPQAPSPQPSPQPAPSTAAPSQSAPASEQPGQDAAPARRSDARDRPA
jgi:hypothetical protein